MTNAEQVAKRLLGRFDGVKSGSLRIWGQWFGRPMDNTHRLVDCDAERDLLRLQFDEEESLLVWAPSDVTINGAVFKIQRAERVRWEWFYYGRPKVEANRYFEDYVRNGDAIVATTNVDWYEPDLRPDAKEPAVAII